MAASKKAQPQTKAKAKIVSFNVNGIRARLHQLEMLNDSHAPDVVAIQECKVVDEEFPHDAVKAAGYPYIQTFGQKGHYGVTLLSKTEPENVVFGVPWRADDQQRRLICADYNINGLQLRVLNGYYPQGDSREHPTKFPNKTEFYADILKMLEESHAPDQNLLVVGDMNVAPSDLDIGIGEDNKKRWLRTGKASFLPEEREWLQKLYDWGLTDTYVHATADADRLYSWFDYRSKGFDREPRRGLRIDLILATAPLLKKMTGVGIDYDLRGAEKPSDHCPIWCEFG